jgi:hypothetical protein
MPRIIFAVAVDERLIGGKPINKHHNCDGAASAKLRMIGAVHTNTIEDFWGIFKRGIVGSFHKVSRKYMPLYIAEFQFRYNNRENAEIFRTAIEGC